MAIASNHADAPKIFGLGLISQGCQDNDISEVSQGIEQALARTHRGREHELLALSLHRALAAARPDVIRYLIEQRHAPLDRVTPSDLAYPTRGEQSLSPSVEILQTLVGYGWDINQQGLSMGMGPGKRLLQYVAGDEALVRWCLEHGASVQQPELESDPFRAQTLLESAAAHGSLFTFKLLRTKGAAMGLRPLHFSAQAAAMDLVKYLVDELRVDVNAMDVPEGQPLPNRHGTPLNYAIMGYRDRRSEDVVRFLLERGADPHKKDCWGICNAFRCADMTKKPRATEILEEWRRYHERQGS